jgi:hypothetical protein
VRAGCTGAIDIAGNVRIARHGTRTARDIAELVVSVAEIAGIAAGITSIRAVRGRTRTTRVSIRTFALPAWIAGCPRR